MKQSKNHLTENEAGAGEADGGHADLPGGRARALEHRGEAAGVRGLGGVPAPAGHAAVTRTVRGLVPAICQVSIDMLK